MEEKAGCFVFIVLQMPCCKCSVTLPNGANGVGLQCMIVVFPDHLRLLSKDLSSKGLRRFHGK